MSAEPDGFYGWVERNGERVRVDVLPPDHLWRGDSKLEGSKARPKGVGREFGRAGMGICSLTGNLQALTVSIKPNGIQFYGPLTDIEFIDSGALERPRNAGGHVTVFGHEGQSWRDHLKFMVATHLIRRETAERLMGSTSCAWISADKEHVEGLRYLVSVVLPKATFDAFARMSEQHFGRNIVYHLSFDYLGLVEHEVEGFEHQPSSARFYAGESLGAVDERIEVTFRPGEFVLQR